MQTDSSTDQGFAKDLFEGELLHCIPQILPGETLYSWCSRYHRISGSTSASTTSLRLFGSRSAGFVVDLPGRLDHFCKVTGYILGSPANVIRAHTLYPYYSIFRPPQTMAKVETLMQGNSVERVKFILGLPASRAASSHPLKFCSSCARQEAMDHGIASWWREHQWPSVWMCRAHQRPLEYLHSSTGRNKQTSWITPDNIPKSAPIILHHIRDTDLRLIDQLQHLSCNLIIFNQHFRPDILRLAFIKKLRERSWLNPFGTIKWRTIRNEFTERYKILATYPGFDFIHSAEEHDFGFLGPILRGGKRIHHPLKYILVIDLLFKSVDEFITEYKEHSKATQPDISHNDLKNISEITLSNELKRLVVAKAQSLNQAARQMGISINLAINIAKRHDIKFNSRPKKENPIFLLKLNLMLEEGAPRKTIVANLGVTSKWLTAFFARNPDQRESWLAKNLSRELTRRRAELIKILEQYPHATQKTIRSVPNNPFQWLKRNDEEWLRKSLPFFETKKSNNSLTA